MSDDDLSSEQVAEITRFVDIEAAPSEPSAHLIFGTNQAIPADIVIERYHQGLAPFIIVTGGVNRHNGIVEGRTFHSWLVAGGVPDQVIRVEDGSANTWQNVEFALPFLYEALEAGLPLTAVSKWYHRRAIQAVRKYLPDLEGFYGISWEPLYSDAPITRVNWMTHPEGKRKVVREWREVSEHIAEGKLADLALIDGQWR